MFREALKNPPKQYRPAPFWSWNEKLDPVETRKQVREMESVGLGGYFMHARGGLQTEYMSEDWFDNIRAACKEGESLGMLSWGYDENGWPSGFGSGAVNGLGEKYQQKYLRFERADAPVSTEHTIINVYVDGQNYHFYYEVNPFYVDTLDGEVIDAFIASTHRQYKERLETDFQKMSGFFTDEPQVSRNGIPWSFTLEREYQRVYGVPLAPLLPALFMETGEYRAIRYRFWKLVQDLFAENFMGRIWKWCRDNHTLLTGHVCLEELFHSHILSNGACMPTYEYMDIPGMDHLGRVLASIQTEMQLSSVANQLGKKQILSETFALCGWNVSFEDLRWIYESQMVHGINYLCQHLEGYSLRGLRKRDYPASLFRHQPWWKYYRTFNDAVSRIGMLIAEGRVSYDILVLHTIETGWILENNNGQENYDRVDGVANAMIETMRALEQAQFQYHLGDGRIMARHGWVENGLLKIGTQSYNTVIVPPSECYARSTYELLKEFKAQGGRIIFTETQPTYIDGVATDEFEALKADCPVVHHQQIATVLPEDLRKIKLEYEGDPAKTPVLTCFRRFEEEQMTMYYLCNPCETAHELTIHVHGKSAAIFDPFSGDETPVEYTRQADKLQVRQLLQSRGSLILFVYDDERIPALPAEVQTTIDISSRLKGDWSIVSADDNGLTLDTCDVYFDGQKAGENIPISDVQEMACAFGRMVKTELVYHFTVQALDFSTCKLVVETPELFEIRVNDQIVPKNIVGWYHDIVFQAIDIRKYVTVGENTIRLCCDFIQPPAVYENLKKSLEFESEKNKLSYGMELEAIYLKGDFGVYSDAPFEALARRGLRTAGSFHLGRARTIVSDGNLAEQGYPFFAGQMTFRKTVLLSEAEVQNAQLTFDRLCSTVTEVRMNGHDAGKVMWQPYTVSLAPYAVVGENTIEITVTGNLRNMLGPFHLSEGEAHAVSPRSFFHTSPVWVHGTRADWVDSYCFVEYGLFF